VSYRISGHESFSCRYAWLPKVVHCLERDNRLLSKEEEAMVALGVGKNMVRSIRFWAHATDIVSKAAKDGRSQLTDFATTLLGEEGLDPFLEDIRTLWLLHWNLATHIDTPLLAWDYLLNRWQEPELVPSVILKALQREATNHNDSVSPTSLAQHFDTFIHTYVPTRGRKGKIREDNLDCPLVELELVVRVGERDLDRVAGRRETIYAFRREEKPEITAELFVYCLNSFWQRRHPKEATLSLREVAHGHGSPGQVFKLPEEDILNRLDGLGRQTAGAIIYGHSNLQQIRQNAFLDEMESLRRIYGAEARYD
jgi:hypothetical protein